MDLNSLMQAAQRAGIDPGQVAGAMGGGGGGQGMPQGMPPGGGGGGQGMPPMGGASEGGDMAQQLMSLVGKVMSTPKGAQMAQALMQMIGGGGGMSGGGAPPPPGTVMGRDQMMDRMGMNTPRPPGGYADDALDVPPGRAPLDPASGPLPGQRNMGAYLNANKPPLGAAGNQPYPTRVPSSDEDQGPGNFGPGQQRMGDYLNNQQYQSRIPWVGSPGHPTPGDMQYMDNHPTDEVLQDFQDYFKMMPQVGGPDQGPSAYPGRSGQENMGGYLNANKKKLSTEEELDQTQKNMGKDKSDDHDEDD